MNETEKDKIRLSDRILSALQLALAQEDLDVSEQLARALDHTLTRKPCESEQFVERRDYPPEMEKAMSKLNALRKKTETAASNQ